MALTGPVVLAYSPRRRGGSRSTRATVWAGEEHDLTAGVLFWMLTPGWSGSVEGACPSGAGGTEAGGYTRAS